MEFAPFDMAHWVSVKQTGEKAYYGMGQLEHNWKSDNGFWETGAVDKLN